MIPKEGYKAQKKPVYNVDMSQSAMLLCFPLKNEIQKSGFKS